MEYSFLLNGTPVQVETAPVITETFDETLDSAQVVLKANDTALPYAPMQLFQVAIDSTTYNFYIVSDVVETFSYKPLKYKHTLTLTQNTRKLSKHIVRNTVFSQPINLKKSGYYAVTNFWNGSYYQAPEDYNGNKNHWIESITLDSKEQVFGNLKYKINAYKVVGFLEGEYVKARLEKVTDVADFGQSVTLSVHGDRTSQDITITNNNINKWIESESLTSFVKNQHSFYFCLDNLNFINGSMSTTNHNLRFIMQVEYELPTCYYNCYSLLSTIIAREKKNGTYHNNSALFSLPTSGDLYDLLKNTIPPNFTFTQSTFFDVVADIFKLFDATFTLDSNNVLGIEYQNEYQSDVSSKTFSSQKSTIGEEKYNSGLINFYQDARLTESFPSTKSYAPLRSDDLGIPSAESYYFITPHNIQYVDKMNILCKDLALGCFIDGSFFGGGVTANVVVAEGVNIPIDITTFVVESSLWTLLNNTSLMPYNNDYSQKIQTNCLSYSTGDNKVLFSRKYQGWLGITQSAFWNMITCAVRRWSGWRYKNTAQFNLDLMNEFDGFAADWYKPRLQLDYTTTIDGILKKQSINDKYNGEIIVNQSNGAVDLDKLGLNMDGLSLKLGEPTLTMRQSLTNFNDRIKKGQYIIKDGEKWVANICRYTLFNDKIEGVIDFSKNFNALSSYVKVNREKRLTTIDKRLTNRSEIIMENYLYYAIGNETDIQAVNDYAENSVLPCSVFSKMLFGDETNTIDYVLIDTTIGGTTSLCDRVVIPTSIYSAGNTFCIESSFTDSISAGNQLLTQINSGWFFNNCKYFSRVVKYTNDNGFCDFVTVSIKRSKDTTYFSDNYPQLTYQEATSDTTLGTETIYYFKQPNEVMAFNYEFHFLPLVTRKTTDFVGAKLIKRASNIATRINDNTQFVLYASTETYDILDTQAKGTALNVLDYYLDTTIDEGNYSIRLWKIRNVALSYRSLCIADQYGNILFAKNFDEIKSTSTSENRVFGIKLVTRNNKLLYTN